MADDSYAAPLRREPPEAKDPNCGCSAYAPRSARTQKATCAVSDRTQESAHINHSGAARSAMPIGRVWRQIGWDAGLIARRLHHVR